MLQYFVGLMSLRYSQRHRFAKPAQNQILAQLRSPREQFSWYKSTMSEDLTFLKLGGSLITEKTTPYAPRLDLLSDLAGQIARAMATQPGLSLVLGHGSGSFGHTAARQFGTREGLPSHGKGEADEKSYWRGFSEVWFQASALNRPGPRRSGDG